MSADSDSSSFPPALAAMEATFGADFVRHVQSSKLLLVGAGGIGCELLKNLALSGFSSVSVIDLDTIDVSNLNRQLLFRSQHVGQPKCTVAAQVAADLAPTTVSYQATHGNVCDSTTANTDYLKQFDLVLNALDNVTARRRVNRLCLAAGVPLVEAGTTGYHGQVSVIDKDSATPCYECKTQEMQKVYPICTIRSTPSMPVHTIVWAKELYKLLFGEKEAESMLYEEVSSEEPSTYMAYVQSYRALIHDSTLSSTLEERRQIAKDLITALYQTEIQKQLDMDRYKAARKTPAVLKTEVMEEGMNVTAPTVSGTPTTAVWSTTECLAELIYQLTVAAFDDDTVLLPSFDKDDPISMAIVTASSNLRSAVFQIEPLQSYYAAKGIAGNIIPAIATTNAVTAGLQILQTLSILQTQKKTGSKTGNLKEACRYVNCLRNATRNGLYLTATALENPNPKCFVCQKASVTVALDVNKWTLQDFLTRLVKKDLGFEEPSLLLGGSDCVWEEGKDSDPAFLPNAPKLLPNLPCGGLQDGSICVIEDFSQDLTVEVTICSKTDWKVVDGETVDDSDFRFEVSGSVPKAAAAAATEASAAGAGAAEDDEDDIVLVMPTKKKRAAAAEEQEENGKPPAKKRKATNGNNGREDEEVIEIE